MSDMTPVPADAPVMIAWKAYQATPEYANAKRWASEDAKYVEGSLWAAFVAGFTAPSAPPAPAPGELDLDELERLARHVAELHEEVAKQTAAKDWAHADLARMALYRAEDALTDACTHERVAQLVAAAKRLAEVERAAAAFLVAWDRDEPLNEVELALRLLVKPYAARASRPTEETDA